MNNPVGPEKMQQIFDEAQASMRDLARVATQFWKSLIEEGMPPASATQVVMAWVASLASAGTKQ